MTPTLPPTIPGVTHEPENQGSSGPMDLLAQLFGMGKPSGPRHGMTALSEGMEKLREAAEIDPRLGPVVGEALKLLIRGPKSQNRDRMEGQGESFVKGPLTAPRAAMRNAA